MNIDYNKLKLMLLERGVPADQWGAVANKILNVGALNTPIRPNAEFDKQIAKKTISAIETEKSKATEQVQQLLNSNIRSIIKNLKSYYNKTASPSEKKSAEKMLKTASSLLRPVLIDGNFGSQTKNTISNFGTYFYKLMLESEYGENVEEGNLRLITNDASINLRLLQDSEVYKKITDNLQIYTKDLFLFATTLKEILENNERNFSNILSEAVGKTTKSISGPGGATEKVVSEELKAKSSKSLQSLIKLANKLNIKYC